MLNQAFQSQSNASLPAASLSDTDLFIALQTGQTKALNFLYNRHIRLVRSVAFKVLGNLEDAEEVAQEVFLSLQRNTFDASRGTLKGFLMMVARSRAIDRLRSQQSRLQRQKNWQVLTKPNLTSVAPMEYVEQEERSQVVRDALPHLSIPQQKTLDFFYYKGLSQPEIARQFNKPLGTVKTYARQGVIHLRSILQEAGTL
jgi:RNA polymerase sigma-70 factor, ECF subfamily